VTKFNIGDQVKILPEVQTLFVGAEGVIHEVAANDRGISTLDRYVVMFKWGEKQIFYDVQLARIQR
jgi:hypothetical protein